MGYPTNPNLLRRINRDSFFEELDMASAERIYPAISERVEQETSSVIRVGMGGVPKPTQIGGSTAGTSAAIAKQMKDYQQTTTVVPWDLTVDMPREMVEDLPEEVARLGREHGNSASAFFDERAIAQLDSTTALGYDGVALYSTVHPESGTNQDNAKTSPAATGTKPTAAELEVQLEVNLPALRLFTDDQGHFVNEGVKKFTILIPPDYEWIYNLVLNPNLSQQAIDSSGVTGKFRGMFDIVVSGYVPATRHYIFAQNRIKKALGYYVKTPWNYFSNIGTESDAWNFNHTALFTGYARFEFLPRAWNTTLRHVWS